MRKLVQSSVIFVVLLWSLAGGQVLVANLPDDLPLEPSSANTKLLATDNFGLIAVLPPPMSPDSAMQIYQNRMAMQAARLSGFSAVTLIHAELLDLVQRGECELHSRYIAPYTLQFNSVQYRGDQFVKANVIVRLLQSEADHVRKGEGTLTALTRSNYKFSHSGTTQVNGRVVHAYDAKPRAKRLGLFKGHVYLDPATGSLVRTEGTLVKTPSFFIKRISFVQDYAEVGGFTFPVHVHVNVTKRVIGLAVVDIYHRDYRPASVDANSAVKTDEVPNGKKLHAGSQLNPQLLLQVQ